MRKILLVSLLLGFIGPVSGCAEEPGVSEEADMGVEISLPDPEVRGRVSVEEAINNRHSVRSFSRRALELEDVSQVLWAAGGMRVDAVSAASRSYPSAGGAYPLEFYLVAGNVEGLDPGIYLYDASGHSLSGHREGDLRGDLASAALGQGFVGAAPATIVITADYARSTGRYGDRGVRYVYMDAGHSGENIYLACVARGLGTVAVGAFRDDQANGVINPPGDEEVIYIFPIGHPE